MEKFLRPKLLKPLAIALIMTAGSAVWAADSQQTSSNNEVSALRTKMTNGDKQEAWK